MVRLIQRDIKAIQGECIQGSASAEVSLDLLLGAAAKLEHSIDLSQGGFGDTPNSSLSMDLRLLLRVSQREPRQGTLDLVRLTLDRMAAGGIYDHLGGGFARYSVDESSLVPHFEKMLCDNALLTLAYVEGFQVTGNFRYAAIVRETLDYVLRDMTDPLGGFYSTENADSEGVAGKFYLWKPQEICRVLGGDRGSRFCYVYDVSDSGNFEHGQSMLNLYKSIAQCAALHGWDAAEVESELAEDRAKLFAHRERRVHPRKDEKVLVSWNALTIDALARASAAVEQPLYLKAAQGAADFILTNVRRTDGRLLHAWRHGRAKCDAYLDDYTYLINALVSLYEVGFDEQCIDEAVRLADCVLHHFADPTGGFFYTADDHEQLIARHKDLQDRAVPSGNSMAAYGLLRLGRLIGRPDYVEAAARTMHIAAPLMQQHPTAAGQMLLAADFYLGPSRRLVLVAELQSNDADAVLESLHARFLPRDLIACRPPAAGDSRHLDSLFAVRTNGLNNEPVLYVWENLTCQSPAIGKDAVLEKIAIL
jgi:uncharacterized protein YyaL (SSP411 family)